MVPSKSEKMASGRCSGMWAFSILSESDMVGVAEGLARLEIWALPYIPRCAKVYPGAMHVRDGEEMLRGYKW